MLLFVLFLLLGCLVPGDDLPEQQVRRVNPGRATSKRYRTSETTAASSSVPPQMKKMSASKPKPRAKSVTEMSAKEFWEKRRCNPYEVAQEPALVNRPFWNRF